MTSFVISSKGSEPWQPWGKTSVFVAINPAILSSIFERGMKVMIHKGATLRVDAR